MNESIHPTQKNLSLFISGLLGLIYELGCLNGGPFQYSFLLEVKMGSIFTMKR